MGKGRGPPDVREGDLSDVSEAPVEFKLVKIHLIFLSLPHIISNSALPKMVNSDPDPQKIQYIFFGRRRIKIFLCLGKVFLLKQSQMTQ